jgi:hypothetical protein
MNERFCRGLEGPAKDIARSIDLEEVLRVESCLVESRSSYEQEQGFALQDSAEVAARA